MKTKKWMSLAAFVATLLLGSSCEHDWGKMDPPAGDQVYPTMQSIAAYTFDSEEEISDPVVIQLSAYEDGAMPALYEDELAKSPVLDLTGGYARFNNPLKSSGAQNAVSYTFWMKQVSEPVLDEEGNPIEGQVMPQDVESPIMYWENENGSASLSFSANGWIKYDGLDSKWEQNNPAEYKTGYITPDEWHYVALILRDHGYAVYVDGEKKTDITSSDLNYEGAVQFAANAPYMYFNYGADTHTSFYLEDLTVYRNQIEAKQIARPKKGNIWGGNGGNGGGVSFVPVPDPIYYYDFERGLGSSEIVGSGELKNVGGNFGTVFQNGRGGMRVNYLKLPSDVFVKTGTNEEITISFWVNSENAGESSEYMWAPIFSAYDHEVAGTGCPMLVCQYRGTVQQNMNGHDNSGGNWCDYTNAQCDQGTVTAYHGDTDWLADKKWHHYAVTFTKTSAAVYFDGEIANSWTIDGVSDGARCEIFGKSELDLVCLGGLQAWSWSDNDPAFMFDDVAIYDHALSQDQIKTVIAAKENDIPDPIYFNNFENGLDDAVVVGNGFLHNVGGDFGTVFQNATGAAHANYLTLPSDAMMRTGETQEMTVAMWVNATPAASNSDYAWSPIFSAYSEAPNPGNHAPLVCCQYRGVIANNMNAADNVGGNWCDYTNAQCEQGEVIQSNVWNAGDWLEDKQWHHYAVTFTKTSAAVYFDGELHNSWVIDGSSDGARCEIFGDARLSYICVGGNQSWWDDWDGEWWIDNVSIYNKALTQEQVQQLASTK
ncbi:MAG: LamG domain-containing protein [Muribaculum sp.]|nr:LamG domain-containing protein [Muribaculum sp.]